MAPYRDALDGEVERPRSELLRLRLRKGFWTAFGAGAGGMAVVSLVVALLAVGESGTTTQEQRRAAGREAERHLRVLYPRAQIRVTCADDDANSDKALCIAMVDGVRVMLRCSMEPPSDNEGCFDTTGASRR